MNGVENGRRVLLCKSSTKGKTRVNKGSFDGALLPCERVAEIDHLRKSHHAPRSWTQVSQVEAGLSLVAFISGYGGPNSSRRWLPSSSFLFFFSEAEGKGTPTIEITRRTVSKQYQSHSVN